VQGCDARQPSRPAVEWSEQHFVRMDDESGKQLALEVEANFVALRLKKQLDAYWDNWETIVGCQFIAGLIAFVAILAFVKGKFEVGVAFSTTSAAGGLVVLHTCNRRNLQAWKRMALPLLVLISHDDSEILTEHVPVDGGAVTQHGTCSAFIQTDLGARVRRRIAWEDLLPSAPFGCVLGKAVASIGIAG
jgi:hypothetical protein